MEKPLKYTIAAKRNCKEMLTIQCIITIMLMLNSI